MTDKITELVITAFNVRRGALMTLIRKHYLSINAAEDGISSELIKCSPESSKMQFNIMTEKTEKNFI